MRYQLHGMPIGIGLIIVAVASADSGTTARPVSDTQVALRADASLKRLRDEIDASFAGNAEVPGPQGERPDEHAETLKLPPRPSVSQFKSRLGRLRSQDTSWWLTRAAAGFGVFLAIIAVQALVGSKSRRGLPPGAVQVCGKVPLDAKQSLHLVRIGERLLVLLESPQGMQRLAEITDTNEVSRLLGSQAPTAGGHERQRDPRKSSPTVSDVLAQFREFEHELG